MLKQYLEIKPNILKCVSPNDRPLNIELNNCIEYFNYEILNHNNLKVIIILGKIAFSNYMKNKS